jgi:hypothetical protein
MLDRKFTIVTTKLEKDSYKAKGGDIMFYNDSATDLVMINGFPLPPKGYFSDDANMNEINDTIYTVAYPAGVIPNIYVREKQYK